MTTRGLRWSKLDLDKARRLYEQGLSFSQVGRQLGHSATYLARRFKAAGIPARPEGRPLTTPAPPVDLDELVRLRHEGRTYPRLAERYGLSHDTGASESKRDASSFRFGTPHRQPFRTQVAGAGAGAIRPSASPHEGLESRSPDSVPHALPIALGVTEPQASRNQPLES